MADLTNEQVRELRGAYASSDIYMNREIVMALCDALLEARAKLARAEAHAASALREAWAADRHCRA